MPDPWTVAVNMLQGLHPVPPVRWPADRTRVFLSVPDLDEILIPVDAPLTPSEAEVIGVIARAPTTLSKLADALLIGKGALSVRLNRLQRRGLVCRAGRVWQLAACRSFERSVCAGSGNSRGP